MNWTYPLVKRALDLTLASAGLTALGPLMLACAAAVRLESRGPAIFRHERVGRGGVRFKVLKFRSMVADPPGLEITSGADARITRIGRWLRRTKADELPQLLNVLRGDMSLVGPRPEVARYVDLFPAEYARILSIKPGITDPASITFRDEERILAAAADPEAAYVREILPAKISLYLKYLDERSIGQDLKILLRTIVAVMQ
jgi:lipopolysaccharide/colanic/teichoic acid biosynthesis glycosyltransferase